MPSNERSFKTPTLVLRRMELGEADWLLTLLTPHHGKLDAIAKGARKINSRKIGHVELFTRADMLIHTGRELGIVVQAEMNAAYVPLRDQIERGSLAGYAAELVDRFTFQGDITPRALFDLLDVTFARIGDDADPRLAARYFEMHLLDLVGFRPELSECVIGHEAIQPEDQFFSITEGGVVCPRDAARGTSYVPLPVRTLKLMRHLQRSGYEDLRGLAVSLALHDDLERVMLSYVSFLLERRPRSADMVKRLR